MYSSLRVAPGMTFCTVFLNVDSVSWGRIILVSISLYYYSSGRRGGFSPQHREVAIVAKRASVGGVMLYSTLPYRSSFRPCTHVDIGVYTVLKPLAAPSRYCCDEYLKLPESPNTLGDWRHGERQLLQDKQANPEGRVFTCSSCVAEVHGEPTKWS